MKKIKESKFSLRYKLESIPLKFAGFSTRIGTVSGDFCSFLHLVKPYNVYEEVEFKLGEKVKMIKLRPRNYVRKDCEEAIEKLIQRSDETYWQDMYGHYKQIEMIDLGMSARKSFGSQKFLKF